MEHAYSTAVGSIMLRPLVRAELESLRQLRNKNRHMFVYSGYITPEDQQAWFENYLKTPGDYLFSVYYENDWVGSVSLYNVSDGYAEFGRLLIDKAKTKRGGLGVDATRAACDIATRLLGVRKLCLDVYCDNPKAQITYLKAGFQPTSIFTEKDNRKMLHMEYFAATKVGQCL